MIEQVGIKQENMASKYSFKVLTYKYNLPSAIQMKLSSSPKCLLTNECEEKKSL